MKILFLAPQPFFQERGTPIAERLALEVLSQRGVDEIHLLTYHEGRNIEIAGVVQTRIHVPAFIKKIKPGISIKKLVCDLFFLFSALRLAWVNRKDQYALVHAVEESAFVACLLKLFFGIPYIYDMDSSLALQLTEKWRFLRPALPLLEYFEGTAVKFSTAVVPVCDALALIAERHGSKDTQILRDISLLDMGEANSQIPGNLPTEAAIPPEERIVLYIGNLEEYQGIDLLIKSFRKAQREVPKSHLVIIGGADDHIAKYQQKIRRLGIEDHVHLIGRRPVSSLAVYLRQADILVSPRIRGNNTPMKIYSYLHSGRAIVATALPTHTQVLTTETAILSKCNVNDFSKALVRVLTDEVLRKSIGNAAKKLAEERYTFEVFSRDLNSLYDRVGVRLAANETSSAASA